MLVDYYSGAELTKEDREKFKIPIKNICLSAMACGLVWMVLSKAEGKAVFPATIGGVLFALGLIGMNAVLRIPYYLYIRRVGVERIKYPNLIELLLGVLSLMLSISLGNLLF